MKFHPSIKIGIVLLLYLSNASQQSFAMETVDEFSVDQEKAIQIAKKAAEETGFDLDQYTPEVYKNNGMWRMSMSILKASPGQDEQALYEFYSSKLRDRDYWVIYFVQFTPDGRRPKDGSVTVIIDKKTCEVLLIEPGG